MATLVDSQLTKAYLVPITADLATVAKIETAKATAEQLTCFQTFGDLVETRASNEYKCIDSNDFQVSVGSITGSEIPVEFLFDSQDATGQAELRTMFDAKTRRILIVELNDEPTTGVSPHPTYIHFEVANLSSGITIALDAAVVYKTNMKVCSRMIWNMAAGTTV